MARMVLRSCSSQRRLVMFLLSAILSVAAGGISEKYFEQQGTVFSPEGRLYQVEYSALAVERHGEPSVAVRGRSAAVLAARRRPLGPLVEASSVAAVHRVCAGVGCCVVGVAGDELRQVAALRTHAQEFRAKYGHAPPSAVLAKLIADDAQHASQTGETRPLGVTAFIIGDDYGVVGSSRRGRNTGPMMALYRVDSTGQFYRCRAAAVGRACEDTSTWLADHLSETAAGAVTFSADASVDHSSPVEEDSEAAELVQVALRCLLQAGSRQSKRDRTGDDSKSTERSGGLVGSGPSVDDFQVGVVSAAAGFRFLSTAELETALNAAVTSA